MIWKPTENGTGGGAGGIRSAAAAAYSCTFSTFTLDCGTHHRIRAWKAGLCWSVVTLSSPAHAVHRYCSRFKSLLLLFHNTESY